MSPRPTPALRLAAGFSRLFDRLGAEGPAHQLRLDIIERMMARAVRHHMVEGLDGAIEAADRIQLLHLLTCRRCRQRARRSLSRQLAQHLTALAQEEFVLPPGPEVTGMPSRTALCRELPRWLTLPPGVSRGWQHDEILETGEVGAAALLAAASDHLSDPARGEELAGQALAALMRDRGLSGEQAITVRLSVLALLVLFRHRLGRLAAAEATYEEALAPLASEPVLSRPRASLLAALAQVRWTQGRRDEAASLFATAAWIFARLNEIQADAACRVQAGFAFLEEDNLERALPLLELGWSEIDAELAPALKARAAFGLAYCWADLKRPMKVAAALRGVRVSEVPHLDEGEETFGAWWMGRIATCRRRYRQAEALIESARRRLLTGGSLGESARCSLDLLLVRTWNGPRTQLYDIANDLVAAFGSHPEVARCAELLGAVANLAARESPCLKPTLWSVHRIFIQLPLCGFRPDLIRSVQSLADPLLVAPARCLKKPGAGRLLGFQP